MISHIAAAAAMIAAQAAPAAQGPCLARADAANLMVVVAPAFIEGAASRCATMLPEGAFLRGQSGALAERIRADGRDRHQSVLDAFSRMSGRPLPAGARPEALTGSIGQMLTASVTPRMDAAACAGVSGALEAMAPLPTDNIGRLLASMLPLLASGMEGRTPRLCPA
jgi:hypothetical protein